MVRFSGNECPNGQNVKVYLPDTENHIFTKQQCKPIRRLFIHNYEKNIFTTFINNKFTIHF